MRTADYQSIVAKCTAHHTGAKTAALVDIVFGIATESAEVIAEVKKAMSYGTPLDEEATAAELGDLLFSVAAMANLIGYDLEEIMLANAKKVQQKHVGLTASLQKKVSDDDTPLDISSSRTIQLLKLALKLAHGRSRGVPHMDVSDEVIIDGMMEAARYEAMGFKWSNKPADSTIDETLESW